MKHALIEAAKNNNLEEVRRLLEAGANVHAETGTALIYASNNGHVEVVHLLLEAGADVHAEDDWALRESVDHKNLEVVRVLLEAGADVHAENDWALRIAAEDGHLEIVRLLLEAGADVHAQDDEALAAAVGNEHLEVVRLLLEAGADVHIINFDTIENAGLLAILNSAVSVATEERRRAALEQEQKNEELRIAALDEVKNREEKAPENPFIDEHCSSTENLYGDPLKDTDDIVVFELENKKGDCYLKEELKLLRSDQYVRGVGEKAYKLPWSNVWITKTLKEFAERMEGYGPISLRRSDSYVGYNSSNILWVLVEN